MCTACIACTRISYFKHALPYGQASTTYCRPAPVTLVLHCCRMCMHALIKLRLCAGCTHWPVGSSWADYIQCGTGLCIFVSLQFDCTLIFILSGDFGGSRLEETGILHCCHVLRVPGFLILYWTLSGNVCLPYSQTQALQVCI